MHDPVEQRKLNDEYGVPPGMQFVPTKREQPQAIKPGEIKPVEPVVEPIGPTYGKFLFKIGGTGRPVTCYLRRASDEALKTATVLAIPYADPAKYSQQSEELFIDDRARYFTKRNDKCVLIPYQKPPDPSEPRDGLSPIERLPAPPPSALIPTMPQQLRMPIRNPGPSKSERQRAAPVLPGGEVEVTPFSRASREKHERPRIKDSFGVPHNMDSLD